MINELIFLIQVSLIALSALGALYLGQAGLIAFICVQTILANLFIVKQITLFGLHATCTDAFTVGAVLGLNLLQEYYGRSATKIAIWSSFFLLVFYALISQIHLWFQASTADTMQQHFYPILHLMPRIVIASFSVYLLVQYIDAWFYGYLKSRWHNNYLLMRNYLSIIICQLIDTVLFSFLGLYGIVENIWHIILISYCVKLLAILIATPSVIASRYIRVRLENT
jgi:uncharacterized integral membrane protein (TIGR00697 family)